MSAGTSGQPVAIVRDSIEIYWMVYVLRGIFILCITGNFPFYYSFFEYLCVLYFITCTVVSTHTMWAMYT